MVTICFIGYGIFLSLINPLITIIQRPNYPPYSLSLTAAFAYYIIYKYICDYDYEFLMDSIILERVKEVRYFVKKCWNFNSAKFLEKIKQPKLFNFESILFTFFYILDLFIISTIFLIFIVPYYAMFALFNSLFLLYVLIDGLFRYGREELFNNTFLYYVFIMLSPLILPLISTVVIPFYTIYHHFKAVLVLIYEIYYLYNKNTDGFRNVMEFYLVTIIYTFNVNSDNNYFIYVVCKIKVRKYIVNRVESVYEGFLSYVFI
ncbi:hypothetical protein RclHR1_09710009 [Rhizophagus clarus]|uniref:Uncharacterized protein n=1 Tax=Rhizophagus clarus TaxID=94130 RepID=A0A2Z6S5C2_9GLOM|nr:hypothetical protein RclHR1_09710009 [Rhizophagus clarus]GES99177.1 hypothetical protein RCL_e28545_RclHR1_09710009 [Rhizophagus clarus]